MWANTSSDQLITSVSCNNPPSGSVFWDAVKQKFYVIDQSGYRNDLDLNLSLYMPSGCNLFEMVSIFKALQSDPELRDAFNSLVTMVKLKS